MLVKGLERMKLIRVEVSINQFDLGFESEETFRLACFVPVGRALGSALKKHCCLSLIFQQKTLNRKSQRFSLD